MYERILVPVDGDEQSSEIARAALRYAATLADDHGAAMSLFETSERAVVHLSETAVSRLSRTARDEPVDVDGVIDAESERVEAIHGERSQRTASSTLADCDADLLVTGIEERGKFAAALFGSPDTDVLTASRTPVITVRADEAVLRSYPYGSILVPIVDRYEWPVAAERGAEIAAAHDATVHLLSIVNEAVFGVSTWSTDIVDRLEEKARVRADEAAAIATDAGVDDVVTAVSRDSVAAEIPTYAARAEVDLTVLGPGGRTAGKRPLFTGADERVRRNVPTPVFHPIDAGSESGHRR